MTAHDIIENLITLEQQASALGLHVSSRAINNAKNALGWELAGEAEQAAKAANGQR